MVSKLLTNRKIILEITNSGDNANDYAGNTKKVGGRSYADLETVNNRTQGTGDEYKDSREACQDRVTYDIRYTL